jgi:AcrR family transcriptional regulator
MSARSDRRAELLEKVVEALLENGAVAMSLRPLAERVGTSARLLIYHFGSKEALVGAALAEVRLYISASLAARAAALKPKSLRAMVMMFWDWATETANQRCFRLLFEVDGLAMYDQLSFSDTVRRANSAVWVTLIERAAGRLAEGGELFSANATLIVAALIGLLQEFLSTGERERTTAALSALVDLISRDGASPAPDQGPRP